mmetsp:Transcript_23488/g.67282  ORF Transcript_23488/g.67282 Transcript_23488/m.67282 type:complete len:158 (+) Transcript_23488:50-523(+)|eukprot:CAMPEP_0176068384 /NCGR_PEP_ID=MMETSP0120_2-20121206/34136_1 /TAXON_ID=160619 /ORGANISM="Kryptoperidinium foliaceum, Strain CCMP 1326" /LENGTH=157 /DNA_ID=CAMNT_0017402005 /DNA_START=50 /DNA_END=523 /DNA_ORIENTATION=-
MGAEKSRCCRCSSTCDLGQRQQAECVEANKIADVEESDEESSISSEADASTRKRLQDSPQQRPPAAPTSNQLFKTLLVKQGNLPLGVDVNHADRRTLMVVGINDAEGLVMLWNRQHPESAIKVGDRIISVNGVSGDAAKMIEVCTTALFLDCAVLRP